MHNNCINLKIRSKQYRKYFYCSATKKEITLSDCKSCLFCERKPIKTNKYTNKQISVLKRTKTPLKPISKKREFVSKKTYNDTMLKCNNKCVLCYTADNLQLHHINGRGKGKTDNVDNCVMLCRHCHLDVVHKNNKYYRQYLNDMRF